MEKIDNSLLASATDSTSLTEEPDPDVGYSGDNQYASATDSISLIEEPDPDVGYSGDNQYASATDGVGITELIDVEKDEQPIRLASATASCGLSDTVNVYTQHTTEMTGTVYYTVTVYDSYSYVEDNE